MTSSPSVYGSDSGVVRPLDDSSFARGGDFDTYVFDGTTGVTGYLFVGFVFTDRTCSLSARRVSVPIEGRGRRNNGIPSKLV